jgi:hypothetical protein
MLPCPMLSLFTRSLEERSSQSPSPSTACSSFCVLSVFAFSSLLSGCHPACPACPEGRSGRSRRERSEGSAFLLCVSHSPIFHHPQTITALESALTENAPLTRLESALPKHLAFNLYRLRHPTTPAGCKQSHLKPFRIRTYRKTLAGRACPYSFNPSCEGPLVTSPTSAARNGKHLHASVYLSAAQSVERPSVLERCLNGRNS